MIFVIDDDLSVLGVIQRILEKSGYRVKGFLEADKALDEAQQVEPELIISDIVMPNMDGFEFRRAYTTRFPARRTPFVFLSALAESKNVVEGLRKGADDYITKPFDRAVLVAKVEAILRRAIQRPEATFRGSLEHLSPIELWQFCEKRGLTGEVTIVARDGWSATLSFEAGELVSEDETSVESTLSTLMDLGGGTFVIRSRPVGFEAIRSSQHVDSAPVASRSADEAPAGRLSRFRSAEGVFEVETGLDESTWGSVLSVVSLDGEVVSTRSSEKPRELGPEELLWQIDSQHSSVEEMVQKQAKALATKRSSEIPPPPGDRDSLLQLALDRYREKNYEESLKILERALETCPDDKLLKANAAIVRRKLG